MSASARRDELANRCFDMLGQLSMLVRHRTRSRAWARVIDHRAAPWLLWNIWAGYQISNNSLANVQSAYARSYTITRDEVPNMN